MTYIPRKRKTNLERMYAKTKIPVTNNGEQDTSKCWIWNGGTNNAGYGLMRVTDELNMILVHRVSYIETYQNMTYNDTYEVLHQCGNKLCVNPHHLSKGNIKDRFVLMKKYNRFNHITFNNKDKMYVTCEHCGETDYLPHFKRLHRLCKKVMRDKYMTQSISGKK